MHADLARQPRACLYPSLGLVPALVSFRIRIHDLQTLFQRLTTRRLASSLHQSTQQPINMLFTVTVSLALLVPALAATACLPALSRLVIRVQATSTTSKMNVTAAMMAAMSDTGEGRYVPGEPLEWISLNLNVGSGRSIEELRQTYALK